jgi:hypothetical protein
MTSYAEILERQLTPPEPDPAARIRELEQTIADLTRELSKHNRPRRLKAVS